MRKTVNSLFAIFCVSMLPLFTGCMNKDYYVEPEDKELLDHFFDFTTTNETSVKIDYAMKAQILFQIYDQNPYTTIDGMLVKLEDVTPVATGLTDANGTYNQKLMLPSSMNEAYIYTAYLAAPRILQGTVSGGTLVVSADTNTQKSVLSRATTTRAFSLPESLKLRTMADDGTSATWSSNGAILPAYFTTMNSSELSVARTTVSAVFQERLTPTNYLMGQDYATDLITKGSNNEVVLTFITGYTSCQSTLAYYCYPADATLTPEYITGLHKCVVFANALPQDAYGPYGSNNGYLANGTEVRLKYINPDGSFGETWPQGTKIGFALYTKAFTHDYTSYPHYSTPIADEPTIQNKVAFGWTSTFTYFPNAANSSDYRVVLGFEDNGFSGDKDFNDLVFQVSGVETTIDIQEETEEVVDATTRGILAFEDSWPQQGDYDMNDMVVRYTSTQKHLKKTTRSAGANQVITTAYTKNCIVDAFELTWSGANYRNGFGYEVALDNDADVNNITIARNDAAPQKASVTKGSNGKYIIYVFDDAKKELGISSVNAPDMPTMDIEKVTFTVTIPYAQTVIQSIPAYGSQIGPYTNPFLYSNNRTKEVHLIDHAPTSVGAGYCATMFGTVNDSSNGSSTYYRSNDFYPFAIHLNADGNNSSIWNLNLKPESVEIFVTYPKFNEWANGNPAIQWWVK